MATPQTFPTISPELLTPDHVRGLSLSQTTQQYGTLGLTIRFEDELERTGLDQDPGVMWAYTVSMALHANQLRTNGRYIDHILRVALRPLVYYEIVDPEITGSGLLHDGVEDHPKDMVWMLTGTRETNKRIARERCYELIAVHTTAGTAEIVEVVTNPILEAGQDKNKIHFEHTRDVVLLSKKGRVIKLADFADNAIGNHHTIGPKQHSADLKYVDEYRLHEMGLFLPDSMITGEARLEAHKKLIRGHARALARISIAQAAGHN